MARRHRSRALLPTLALAALVALGCEVEWEGARVALETPERARSADTVRDDLDPDLPPLPEAPLLHVVRTTEDGRAVALPAARMTPEGPASLDLPADPPDAWWERFADSLRSPGTELPLYATGRRIGTLVLGPIREPAAAGCPAPSDARILLPPGAEAPRLAFAWAPAAGASPPHRSPRPGRSPPSGSGSSAPSWPSGSSRRPASNGPSSPAAPLSSPWPSPATRPRGWPPPI